MSEQLEYTIKRSDRGYVVSGPALTRAATLDSEAKALSLARALIGGKSGGGYITRPDGERDFYQGSRHLSQSCSSQR